MDNKNFLIRGVIKPLNARYAFVDTTSLVGEAIKRHDLDPVSAVFSAKSLTTGALLSSLLEEREEYTLHWNYSGEIGSIIVNLNGRNDIRGYVKEPHLANITSDSNALFGDAGSVSVVKSLDGKIINSGSAEAGLLDVTEDIGFFFSTSDQIETQIIENIQFTVDPDNPVKVSAGFMLQAMPDCNLEKFDSRRQKMTDAEFRDALLDLSGSGEQRLAALLNIIDVVKDDYSLTNSTPPAYHCSCSYDKMLNAMHLLGKDQLNELFKTNNNPKICCKFCGDEYSFLPDDFDL